MHEPDLLPIVKTMLAVVHETDVVWEISSFEGSLLTIGGLAQRANDLHEFHPLEKLMVNTDEVLAFASEIQQCYWLKLIVRSRSAKQILPQMTLIVFDSTIWEISGGDSDTLRALLEELEKLKIEAILLHNLKPFVI